MTHPVRAFAPASVSNIACGFDILGFALQSESDGDLGPGDIVTASEPGGHGPVRITAIAGDEARLPLEAERNTAAVAAAAMVDGEAPGAAVDLEIEKRMPLESGLGSSAASAVAAVVAVDALLGLELPAASLLRYAVAGEVLASGGAHADNLAPSLLGGLVLVRSLDPEPDVIDLPVPEGLTCALVRPYAEVNTKESRARLERHLPLERAVTQWGNAAALVAALYRSDLKLLSRALVDVVAEPVRAPACPASTPPRQPRSRRGPWVAACPAAVRRCSPSAMAGIGEHRWRRPWRTRSRPRQASPATGSSRRCRRPAHG